MNSFRFRAARPSMHGDSSAPSSPARSSALLSAIPESPGATDQFLHTEHNSVFSPVRSADLLIAVLDNPYRGKISVSPEPPGRVYQQNLVATIVTYAISLGRFSAGTAELPPVIAPNNVRFGLLLR
jgi:hypothetical protein